MFRNWVLENFPFIEDDFDALTDYELFCKVWAYIKEYQKEFDRIEKEIKDFEEYLSTFDIEKTVHEILDVELPLLERQIMNQVDVKLEALNNELTTTINNLEESLTIDINTLSDRVDAIHLGDIVIYDPTNGEQEYLETALQNVYNTFLNTIATALTCLEFDTLELSATDFDAYEITAINFDLKAKEILV